MAFRKTVQLIKHRSSLIIYQFIKFIIIGTFSGAIHSLILVLLIEGLMMNAVYASVPAFLCGVFVSYEMNCKWVFYAQSDILAQRVKFFITALAGFALNLIIMHTIVNYLNMPYLLALACLFFLLPILSFSIHKVWTFYQKPEA